METLHVVPQAAFCEEDLPTNLTEGPIFVKTGHVLQVPRLRGECFLTLCALGHRLRTRTPFLVEAQLPAKTKRCGTLLALEGLLPRVRAKVLAQHESGSQQPRAQRADETLAAARANGLPV